MTTVIDEAVAQSAAASLAADWTVPHGDAIDAVLAGMTTAEIRRALTDRGVKCNGRKAELARCLRNAALAEMPRAILKQITERYVARLTAVRERLDDYDTRCQRRHAQDEWHAAMRAIRNVDQWLAGDHDVSYVERIHGTREEYRVKYAHSALRTALHHVVWAEAFAGLATDDAARAADPFRQS